MKKVMAKPMKKAQNGTVAKKKPAKTYPIMSESGDLADALNEYNDMKKKGTVPKTDAEARKYMDGLNKRGKLGPAKPKMKMGGELKTPTEDQKGLKALPTAVRNKMGFKKNGGTMKKAMMGTDMSASSMMKMGGKMAKQAAVAIAMKKAGKTPKKKMQYGGEAASMKPTAMMKKGGMMKKCKYGCK